MFLNFTGKCLSDIGQLEGKHWWILQTFWWTLSEPETQLSQSHTHRMSLSGILKVMDEVCQLWPCQLHLVSNVTDACDKKVAEWATIEDDWETFWAVLTATYLDSNEFRIEWYYHGILERFGKHFFYLCGTIFVGHF